MPGGFGGGGGPPLKTCPRCGRKSVDELSNDLVLGTMVATMPFAVIMLSLTARYYGRPAMLLIPVVAGIGHAFVRLFAIKRGWTRRCDRCDFSWPLAPLPFLDEWQQTHANDRHLRAELAKHGLVAAPTGRLEGAVNGRAATVSLEPAGDEPGRIRLAVACSGKLGDPRRLQWALEDVLPTRARLEKVLVREGELSVTVQAFLLTRDVLAGLEVLAEAASKLEVRQLHVVEHDHEHETRRCAYCHGEDAAELLACEDCGTLLHEGCWSELGRCPTLGCGPDERVRTRRAEA